MTLVSVGPAWFFGIDIVFELVFAIITLIVSIFAFKIYKISLQKQVKLFGVAFLLISISYFIESILNYLILSKLNENICQVMKINSVVILNGLGVSINILLMTMGLALLAFMTFKTEKLRIYWLTLSMALFAIFFSRNALFLFFLFASIFLIFISWYYVDNYLKNKQIKTLLVAVAFIFLLFGKIHFIFSVDHKLFYVIGHFLEIIAYLLILWNLYLVRK